MKQQILWIIAITVIIVVSGCSSQESATNNEKIKDVQSSTQTEESSDSESEDMSAVLQSLSQLEAEDKGSQSTTSENASADVSSATAVDATSHLSLNYNCNIEADRENFDLKNTDIVVGDNYYSTQINDWYMNFDEYKGKTVEIEGYYIADYLPYLFVGRFGPTCPYCQGVYVCFEFYTKEDLSGLVSGKDWIKVKGILREDEDENGMFSYIEAISIEKMDQEGLGTISN